MREAAAYFLEHPMHLLAAAALLLLLGFWLARKGYLPGLAARIDPSPAPGGAAVAPVAELARVPPTPTAGEIQKNLDTAIDSAAGLIATSDALRAKLAAAAGQLAPPRPS